MGNDHSQSSGIEIEDKAVEVADFWSQHLANLPKSRQLTYLTVFIGELFVSGPLWTVQTPLEKCSKNLMIYRHPNILKYVSSWPKSSKFYLAVEHVKPLSHVFSSLNTLQLCIGLHSILKALCFLHEKAAASHNNVCLASIYITDDLNWKLGSMEFTCKYNELTKDFLSKSRANRYTSAVDVNEEDHIQKTDISKDFIDTYAFFVLTCELLKTEKEEDVPSLEEFKKLCKLSLENADIYQRPKLSELLKHPFFNHEFILIHGFLTDLPLKSDEEKLEFFSTLVDRLKNFDENLVASQLSSLLLSRMVLLNSAAQKELLPRILHYKLDSENEEENDLLFSEPIFKKYIVPRLLEIFCVRDAQIRSLLLHHFKNFIHAFSEEEMQSYILPELLVGIKDTNDILVSKTLQALSILVLILGSNTVIGGKRAKLFTDGRPTSQTIRKTRHNSKRIETSIIPESSFSQSDPNILIPQVDSIILDNLPERQRPDGEEVENSNDEIEQSVDEELEWEDWDIQENSSNNDQNERIRVIEAPSIIEDAEVIANVDWSEAKLILGKEDSTKSRNIRDISDLDIKHQKNIDSLDEIDFFQDMEPEIISSNKFLIKNDETQGVVISKLGLSVSLSENDQGDGWGEEDWG